MNSFKRLIKTGLYFGSFNPIHIGHLAIANIIVEYSELEELWFVVSPHNPLKDKKSPAGGPPPPGNGLAGH
jgi:nicotinate-nucleotide adenylyltransferase